MAVPRFLHAAKRQVDLSPDGGAINVSDARLDISQGAEGPPHIPSVNGAGKTVGSAI